MQRTRLGMTDLEVSPICFGTWQLGGEWGGFDERGDTLERNLTVVRALEEIDAILLGSVTVGGPSPEAA